jgi:acetyl-CoA acyltransferase
LSPASRGEFTAETVTVGGVPADEGPRRDTGPEALAGLKPAFDPGGQVTAGNSSQISDGAAALLITTSDHARRLGLRPLARFHAGAVIGAEPVLMLTAPIPATERVLQRSGLRLDQIGVFEVNEAFATVVLAWHREMSKSGHVDLATVNARGGAIALGHPLGGSGARIMTTMLYRMMDTGARYGLQTMCEGGGLANATILELV